MFSSRTGNRLPAPETCVPTIALPLSSLWHMGETMRDVDPMLSWVAARFKVTSFLDVGAHVGEISLLAAFHFGAGLTVHAYEPHPALHEMCRQNFMTGGLDPDLVVRAALAGGRHTPPKDEVELHERGTSLLGCSTVMTDRIVRTLDVPAFHPDTMPAADVVNIDVEGAEADIVEGYRHWPSVYCAAIETHTRAQSGRIRDVMARMGMELVRSVDHPRFPFRLELWSR